MTSTEMVGHRQSKLTKVFALLLTTALLAAACGGSDSAGSEESDSSEDSSAESTEGAGAGEVALNNLGSPDDFQSVTDFCGDEELTIGLADGYQNSWRQIALAELEAEAAKCPNIKEVVYVNAQGDSTKLLTDIDAMVSQGVDIIITFPDFGDAMLPTLREAEEAGTTVVIWATTTLGGEIGTDYSVVASDVEVENGKTWANAMVSALGGEGNVIFLGGTPGNPTSIAEAEGIKEVFAENPGMTLLEGPVDTNWDVAETQKVMAGLLTQYDQIDGIISDFGAASVGAIRAFQAADRPLPAWATNDSNELGCLFHEVTADEPAFSLATISGRNWLIRLGLRKGLAVHNGLASVEPALVQLPLFEDTANGLEAQCNEDLPPDAILSSQLTLDELTAIFEG